MYKCETKFALSQLCDTRYGAHLRWVPDISYPSLFVPGVLYPAFLKRLRINLPRDIGLGFASFRIRC